MQLVSWKHGIPLINLGIHAWSHLLVSNDEWEEEEQDKEEEEERLEYLPLNLSQPNNPLNRWHPLAQTRPPILTGTGREIRAKPVSRWGEGAGSRKTHRTDDFKAFEATTTFACRNFSSQKSEKV